MLCLHGIVNPPANTWSLTYAVLITLNIYSLCGKDISCHGQFFGDFITHEAKLLCCFIFITGNIIEVLCVVKHSSLFVLLHVY